MFEQRLPQVLLIAVVPIPLVKVIATRNGESPVAWRQIPLGRSGATWIIFSLILSPSVGQMIVAVLDKKWTRSARLMTAIAPAAASAPV